MKMNRRSFIVSSAAVTGGLALGFELPFGTKVVRAQDGSPEVNAWVVIQPNDTVVIRMARSEMGQGTITGLAQLHLGSALTLLQAFLPAMKERKFGRVMFNASRAALGAPSERAMSE